MTQDSAVSQSTAVDQATALEQPRSSRLHLIAERPWLAAACGAAIVAAASALHLWFVPFLVGLVFGVGFRLRRARAAAGFASVAAAVGWAVPLAARAILGDPVLGIARVTAGLAGLPAIGWLAVAATLLVAVIQGLAGAWLGRTASAFFAR
jgi:hypothetical protein